MQNSEIIHNYNKMLQSQIKLEEFQQQLIFQRSQQIQKQLDIQQQNNAQKQKSIPLKK